jgi:FtsZ-binding cell division protein ZapB
MITRESIELFQVSFDRFMEKVPAVLKDMLATIEAKEALEREIHDIRTCLDAMNVANQDLRDDKKGLDQRLGMLLSENARLEHLLASIGHAVKQAQPVQEALASLQNGHRRVIEAH